MSNFKLSENFVSKYKRKKAPFGFNGLGELVYQRTYSRLKADGKNEQWWETVQRVVEGTFNMQKRHIDAHGLGWNAWKAQHSAQEMYDRIFNMKFLPPGRGLWAMGTAITEEKKLFAALNNCAFVSTESMSSEFSKPFCFLMDASMLGVGVGFDTKGANSLMVKGPNESRKVEQITIPDTREGWVESLRALLDSYSLGTAKVEFDYSEIRAEGVPIKGFGGESSGPKPLIEFNNVSVLETCINLIESLDIKEIFINTFYLKDQIRNFINKKNFKPKISIIEDGKNILDTGGGIKNMLNHTKEDDVLIFNPDTIWKKNYSEEIIEMEKLYFSKQLKNILLLVNKDLSFDKNLNGDFDLKDNLIIKNNDRKFIYTGCQILNKKLLSIYKTEKFSINNLWNDLIEKKELYGFETNNDFYHLTDLKTFKKLQDL